MSELLLYWQPSLLLRIQELYIFGVKVLIFRNTLRARIKTALTLSSLIMTLTDLMLSPTRKWQPTPAFSPGKSHRQGSQAVFQDRPGGSDVKESACNAGDLGSIPESGRSTEEGNGYPHLYSCLENSMDRGAWQVTKSWT